MTDTREHKRMEAKRRIIYLVIVLGVCYLLFALALTASPDGAPFFQIMQKGFTAFPVLAAVVTRRLTKDKTPWKISLKIWRQPKLWLFCAFAPGILIALGAWLYFAVFPDNYSGSFFYGGLLALAGAESGGNFSITSPVWFALATVLLSAVFIPIQLLELGEEIGWREYFLPKQVERYGVRRAVLLNGILWGAAHLPLIWFGFNYSLANRGAPFSNMAMMMVVCVTLGILLSYVMLVSGNVMYPAVIHGVVNVIGEVPVYLSVSKINGLLGPNPTGLIGMSGLIALAAVLFFLLGRMES